MNFSSLVGFRYLRARKSSGFLSLITFFSIAGVAIGVATLITVLSVMDGFERALKERLSQGEFHILITGEDSFFEVTDEMLQKVYAASDQVVAVNPVLKTEAIIRVGKKVAGMSVRGITDSHMNAVAKTLVEVSEETGDSKRRDLKISPKGLWLGKELAYRLNLLPGDNVTVISPTETEGPLGSIPRMRKFVLEGIYDSGVPEKDAHVAFASANSVRNFLDMGPVVNSVQVRIRDFARSTAPARSIRRALGDQFHVKDWEQLNSHLFSSLLLERVAMFVILAMIVLVASFNVVTSLSMTVIEKKKEIAILQAMGATQRQINRIFLVQGFVIGLWGTLTGFALGMGVCLFLKTTNVIELPDVFYDRTLPVEITPLYIALILLTAIGLVLAAAYFPARSAGRLTPLEGFREA